MLKIFSKNQKQYSSQKIINRRKLTRQNLIFLFGAIIIVGVLIIVLISNLSFLVDKINEGVSLASDEGIKKPNFFNIEGFETVREKVLSPSLIAPE